MTMDQQWNEQHWGTSGGSVDQYVRIIHMLCTLEIQLTASLWMSEKSKLSMCYFQTVAAYVWFKYSKSDIVCIQQGHAWALIF